LNSYEISHNTTIVIVADNEEEALKIAYEQEFRAIDLIEFSVGAKIKRDKD